MVYSVLELWDFGTGHHGHYVMVIIVIMNTSACLQLLTITEKEMKQMESEVG